MISDQLLLASSTTEGGGGGNVRSSEAPIEHSGGRIVLLRDASVISYGAQADAVVTTARRGASADASDQVLVVFEKKNYTLEKTGGWDTLGMRGTCSAGFQPQGCGRSGPDLARGLWRHSQPEHGAGLASDVGRRLAGIAAGAVERSRKYMRKAARAGGDLPPGMPAFHQGAGVAARFVLPDCRRPEPL